MLSANIINIFTWVRIYKLSVSVFLRSRRS